MKTKNNRDSFVFKCLHLTQTGRMIEKIHVNAYIKCPHKHLQREHSENDDSVHDQSFVNKYNERLLESNISRFFIRVYICRNQFLFNFQPNFMEFYRVLLRLYEKKIISKETTNLMNFTSFNLIHTICRYNIIIKYIIDTLQELFSGSVLQF